MKRFTPRSLVAQLVVLLICVLIIAQVINLVLLVGTRRLAIRNDHYGNVIAFTVEMASDLPDNIDTRLPRRLSSKRPGNTLFTLTRYSAADTRDGISPLPHIRRQLNDRLLAAGVTPVSVSAARRAMPDGPSSRPGPPPPGMEHMRENRPPPPRHDKRHEGHLPPPPGGHPPFVAPRRPPDPTGRPAPGMEELLLSVELEPGVWLNVASAHYPIEQTARRVLIATGLTLLVAIVASIALARWVAGPIGHLTRAAAQFGRGETVSPVLPRGPKDIQLAAEAFNEMQKRISRLVASQRVIIRAIGHDLRTPLTSMRIRAEDIEDPEQRAAFIRRIDEMTEMTEELLRWAKETASQEPYVRTRMGPLLRSVVSDYIDRGHEITLTLPERSVMLNCRRSAMRRAVVNLIDNAIAYGTTPTVRLEEGIETLSIVVEDRGPGIPEDRLFEVTQPFRRLEDSRNKATGGTGLGLSIVQNIAESHGGSLELENRTGGGLRARLIVPREHNPDSTT